MPPCPTRRDSLTYTKHDGDDNDVLQSAEHLGFITLDQAEVLFLPKLLPNGREEMTTQLWQR